MIKEAIIKLSKKQDLTYTEAETVMDEIMSGQATPVQMSAYLTALSLKDIVTLSLLLPSYIFKAFALVITNKKKLIPIKKKIFFKIRHLH